MTVSVPPSVNANSTVICLYFNRPAAAAGSGCFAAFFFSAIYLLLHINIPFSLFPFCGMMSNKKEHRRNHAHLRPARAFRDMKDRRCSLHTYKEHRASQTFPIQNSRFEVKRLKSQCVYLFGCFLSADCILAVFHHIYKLDLLKKYCKGGGNPYN